MTGTVGDFSYLLRAASMGGKVARAVAAGSEHVVVLMSDSTVWACGRNSEGQRPWYTVSSFR